MLRRVCFQRRMLCFRTPNNETSFYPLRVPTGCWSGTRLFMLGTRGCICSSHSHKSKLGPPRGATNTGPLHGISPSCFRTVGSDEFWLGTRLGDVELDGKLENCCRYKGLGDWTFMGYWDHYCRFLLGLTFCFFCVIWFHYRRRRTGQSQKNPSVLATHWEGGGHSALLSTAGQIPPPPLPASTRRNAESRRPGRVEFGEGPQTHSTVRVPQWPEPKSRSLWTVPDGEPQEVASSNARSMPSVPPLGGRGVRN